VDFSFFQLKKSALQFCPLADKNVRVFNQNITQTAFLINRRHFSDGMEVG
jgi:hypothetical protein